MTASRSKPAPRKRPTGAKAAGSRSAAAKKAPAKKTSPGPKKGAVAKAKSSVSPLQKVVTAALEDMKAVNVQVLDVRGMTDVADTMIVASGNSDRHVKSISDRAVRAAKTAGFRSFGVEGARDGEWVLVDLGDLVLHVMLPRVREHYALEQLWEAAAAGASRRE